MKFLLIILFSISAYADRYIVSGKKYFPYIGTEVKKMRNFPAYSAELTDYERYALVRVGYRVEIDHKVMAYGNRSLPKNDLWGYYETRANKINILNNGSGEGSTVCVIDTGVDYEHPSLKDKIIGGVAIVKSSIPDKLDYYDDMGHGTHVSGIISGDDVGLADKSKLFIVKVLDSNGEGYESDVADGIIACIGKTKVINISLGGPEASSVMENALKLAKNSGIINVCAAGNEYGSVGYPAAYNDCLAISAVDENMQLADFSNRGKKIAFAGPGVRIKSSVPGGGYEEWDGTSMAAPHVSAVAAIMLSRGKKKLRAINLGLQRDEQGKGLIDAYRTGKGYFWEK